MKKSARIAIRVTVWTMATLFLATPSARAQQKSFELMDTSIDEIHAAYRRARSPAGSFVQMYLDRINAYDKQGPTINAIITLNPHALEDADKLDAAYKKSGDFVGPLHGIPVLVKDEIDAAGMPTTLGTLVFKDYRPPRDAFVIGRLRAAGAIILGKTTLGEFAAGDTYGSMFGVTRNPYDLERTAGGSSGGSAAALTANFSTVALGEETNASIRRPGTWNDLVSMRPTPGLVSRSGMWDGYPTSTAQMGPMARSVRDLAELLDAMVGYDPEDPVTALGVGKMEGSYTRFLEKNGLKGARIGILRESIGLRAEPGSEDFKKVDAVFEKAVAELKAAGAIVVDPIVIPQIKELLAKQAADPEASDLALRLYLARNPSSPIKTRADIATSPGFHKSIPPKPAIAAARARTQRNTLRYLEAREELAIGSRR